MGTHWLVMDDAKEAARAPYRSRLAAAGRHLPTTRLTTDELMSSTCHHTNIDLERTGIYERRVSAGDEDSYSLATAAARNCLAEAGSDGASLDVEMNCSITKFHDGLTQWLEPTMSTAVAHAIDATNAMTFDVSNACAGMLTGVTILNNWIRQGLVERGLVVSGEYISPLVEELEAGRILPGETIALIALASGLEIGVVLVTVDEDLVNRYGHRH